VCDTIRKGILKGEWALPFYGDLPAMPDIERSVTWDLMLGQESTTKIITSTYERAGFDPKKHLLHSYAFIEGETHSQWRTARGGGSVVDWDLKSTLDGLYVAGEQLFSHIDHSFRRFCRRAWARLIRKVFLADPSACPKCGGRVRIISFIDNPRVIEKILKHLKLWDPPQRPPPPKHSTTLDPDPDFLAWEAATRLFDGID